MSVNKIFKNRLLYLSVFLVLVGSIIITIVLYKRDRISSEKPPHIVLIVVDTLRQDHMSCYGHERKTSSNVDSLVKISRIYYNAYSTSGWTAPAHASLFTGLFAMTHQTTQENWLMNENLVTLAEILSKNGYETFGIVENPVLSKYANFHQGFSRYSETWKLKYRTRENKLYLKFVKYLRNRNPAKPFLIFMNFIAPHSPYNSSGQFINTFVSDTSINNVSNMWTQYFLGKIIFNKTEIQHLKELYDAEILYVDNLIAKIIQQLKKRNLWRDTVFIVTSDHGENIGDHKMMDHVFSLYESVIKIPLIIHYPKLFKPGSEDHLPTQLVDIFPTLLEIAKIETELYPSQGYSLLKAEEREKRVIFCEYFFPKQALKCFREDDREDPALDNYRRRLKSVTKNKKKFIWGSDGVNELYDLSKDPLEIKNLIDDSRYEHTKRKLIKELGNIVSMLKKRTVNPSRKAKEEKLDSDTVEALKSLGYIN